MRRYKIYFEEANYFGQSNDKNGLREHLILYTLLIKSAKFHRLTFFLKKSCKKLAFVFTLFVYLITNY